MRTSLWHLNKKGFPGRLLIVSGLSIIAFGLGPLALPTQSVKRQDSRDAHTFQWDLIQIQFPLSPNSPR